MKFDKDLMRDILLAVEASDEVPLKWTALDLPDKSLQETSYHVMLLHEAGFIEAQNLTNLKTYQWQPKRLTFKGHELLDTIRDDEVWRRTKAGAEKAGGASISFIWELAKAYGKHVAKERLGVDLT
ncbi:hypothetical protein QE385_003930 [Sphingomonas sp. SORGH_AS 950]|uniref:DUF2513 domain-containing protein n=1 Tax=Sphingomonas sp. SORGH_AS_0950 TaxID=3041792 RepID=UPI002780A653|nr:DUF2513 domain-containing protein [Sphingomonas sp. SORGH_AS_0950]MDQ1159533.1 hypothetical protein [Sphingomonas sp. SORGH_AS_0950]